MTEKKEAPAAEELDGIPENIQKRLHVISFTAKWLIIGVVAFFAIQLAFRIFLVNPDEENGVNADTLHHNYCGTFFVTNTVENTYISADAYEKYSAATAAEKGRGVKGIADGIVSAVGIPAVIICIFIALYNTDKNRLFLKHASRWFLVSGLLWAAVNVYAEVSNYLSVQKELPFLVGVPATTRYYCQLYNVLGIPALIVLCALILRRHELSMRGTKSESASKPLKVFAVLFGTASFGFLIYRFYIRINELIMSFSDADYVVRLPFYYISMELPRGLAVSTKAYTDVVLFRFIKDLPVFVAAGFTLVMLVLLTLSAAKNEINTKENVFRLESAMISLVISSLLFNLMGLYEVKLFNGNFSGIYGDVTYTIGVRSLCEPILYAVVLWFALTFVRAVPEKSIAA